MPQKTWIEESDIWQKMTFRLKPKGLVIDDNPGELIKAVTIWIDQTIGSSWIPDWKFLRSAQLVSDIDENIRGMDFVLLDHRLEGNFPPFRNGLEIGQRIAKRHSNLPIFFYTAGINDLKEPGTQGSFRTDFEEFEALPNVTFFDKGDLHPDKNLEDLCNRLVIVSDNLQTSVAEHEHAELLQLLEARVERVRPFRYRIIDYDKRRKTQTLRCLDDRDLSEIQVPSKYLAKLNSKSGDILLKVVEFSGGQILSYMMVAPLLREDLADEVVTLIQNSEHEDYNL